MAEATLTQDADSIDVTAPVAGYASGEVLQLPDGRAGVVQGLRAPVSGDRAALLTAGHVTVAKTTGVVILKGAPVYWDRSANTATPLRAAAGGDFFLGAALEDAASGSAAVAVDINVQPRATIDLLRDPSDTVLVLTAGTPSMTVGAGCAKLAFSTTAEAQKVDILSKNSCPVGVPFIVEGRMAVYDIGDEGSVDINVGIASGTHASDCDAIAESVFFHLDGTSLNILAESDDGTTEVAAADTTVDAVDDTYFDFAIDGRDLSSVKLYVNGVRVLASSTFVLSAATGPLKLLAHIEKGANDTPGEIRIEKLALRAMDAA